MRACIYIYICVIYIYVSVQGEITNSGNPRLGTGDSTLDMLEGSSKNLLFALNDY